MTDNKHTDTSCSGDLVELLRRTYERAFAAPNPTTGVAMVRSYLLKESRLINPDGPEAADRIEALEAENERLWEALGNLINAYTANVDTYRIAGFYTDPETEDEIVEARAALAAINLPARLDEEYSRGWSDATQSATTAMQAFDAASYTQGWNGAIEVAETLVTVYLYPILSSPTRSADWHRAKTAINTAIRALTKENRDGER